MGADAHKKLNEQLLNNADLVINWARKYSLWPMFMKFGINTAPLSARAYGTTTSIIENQVSKGEYNNVAFPKSCIVEFDFPEQDILPAFKLLWYDGGMKPRTPVELDEDNPIAEEIYSILQKEYSDLYHRQASTAYRQQELDRAIALWDRVLEIKSDHNAAQAYRAQALELKQKLNKLQGE